MKKQRITKVPIHYRDRIQQILDDLKDNGIIKGVLLNAAGSNELGSEFIDPIKIQPKGDTYERVIDAGLFNAITDVSKCHFPISPVQFLIPRFQGKNFSTISLSTAYYQVFLTLRTENFVLLVVVNEQHKYNCGFYELIFFLDVSIKKWLFFLLRLPKEMK